MTMNALSRDSLNKKISVGRVKKRSDVPVRVSTLLRRVRFALPALRTANRHEAIHAGHAGDYAPMKLVFSEILDFSLQQAARDENNE